MIIAVKTQRKRPAAKGRGDQLPPLRLSPAETDALLDILGRARSGGPALGSAWNKLREARKQYDLTHYRGPWPALGGRGARRGARPKELHATIWSEKRLHGFLVGVEVPDHAAGWGIYSGQEWVKTRKEATAAVRRTKAWLKAEGFTVEVQRPSGRAATHDVAAVILQQLGGAGRLSAMGVGNFISYGPASSPHGEGRGGVSFRLAGVPGPRANYVKIILAANDTYTVTFGRVGRGGAYRVLKEVPDIYADRLRELIERETGFSLSLGSLGGSGRGAHNGSRGRLGVPFTHHPDTASVRVLAGTKEGARAVGLDLIRGAYPDQVGGPVSVGVVGEGEYLVQSWAPGKGPRAFAGRGAKKAEHPIGVHSIGFPKAMTARQIKAWLAAHDFDEPIQIDRGKGGGQYAWARLRNVSPLYVYRTEHWETSVGRVAVRFAIHKRRAAKRDVEREIQTTRRRVA